MRSSNAGQLLFTGIVRPDRAIEVADGLLRPRFFSGWGIRTVSSAERRYNPMSYHNGSIWPHDNALMALGFARYGLKDAVAQVFTAIFEAASYMDLRRLPELFCGFQRRRGRGPTLYPVACSPQAWASGTPFLILQASLGLEFDPDCNEICLRNPCLPPFLEEDLSAGSPLSRRSPTRWSGDAAGNCHRRRPHRLAVPHALHDAHRLPVFGSAQPMDRQAARTKPGGQAGRCGGMNIGLRNHKSELSSERVALDPRTFSVFRHVISDV